MSRPLAQLSLTVLVVASGCGDESPATASDTAATGTTGEHAHPASTVSEGGGSTRADGPGLQFELEDGTAVRVSDDGAVAIESDGRRVFALRSDPKPRGLRFVETYGGGTGLWNVLRESEEVVPVELFVGASRIDGGVRIEYLDAEGEPFALTVAVSVPGEALTVRSELANDFDAIALPLDCDDEASFHGFGEQYGATDQRGEAFRLWVTEQGIGRHPDSSPLPINGDSHTTYFPMPYYLDARGFGGLFRTLDPVDVDLCASDPDTAWFEVREAIDLAVFTGPTGYDVIRQLGDEVGRPTMPPAWAWRPWIGMQGGRDDVAAEVTRLQDAEIPFSAIWVQDWTGVRPNLDGGFGVEYRWRADTELYPDLSGFIADLHTQNIRFLGYANPFIDPDLDHFEAMSNGGMLLKDASGEDYVALAPNGTSAHPDFTVPETAQYVQSELAHMVEGLGMDGWMADFGEWTPLDAKIADGTDPVRYHNAFPLHWHAQWRAVMDDLRPNGDFAVFARSGAAGVHASAQIYWTGDQECDFSPYDGLPTVVPAMLNLGLSGIPFVTHDIAGFSGGPGTKELFLRWTELGAFTPIMRTHEGNDKNNNWRWESDAETVAHFRRFARIHEALGEELAELAELAAVEGKPMVRHLMLEFPDDLKVRTVSDAFMLGPDLLVAPVVHEGQTTRTVVLPEGTTWFDVWTQDAYEGGATIEIDAPIGRPPVFARGTDRDDLRAIE